MRLDDYQTWTINTAIYPDAGTGSVGELMYLGLGLAGEAGELANTIKKIYRDGDQSKRQDAAKELGDVMWYAARLAEALGVKLEDLLQENHDKLTSRQQRNQLGGSGDDR